MDDSIIILWTTGEPTNFWIDGLFMDFALHAAQSVLVSFWRPRESQNVLATSQSALTIVIILKCTGSNARRPKFSAISRIKCPK